VVLRDPARDPILGLEYPVIVKPAAMDASHGIEPSNVVWDEAAARGKAADLIARFPPAALVEPFINGRDILVGLLQAGAGAPPTLLPLGRSSSSCRPGVASLGFESNSRQSSWRTGPSSRTRNAERPWPWRTKGWSGRTPRMRTSSSSP
jgi:hypothetical protein